MTQDLDVVPEAIRDKVRRALVEAFLAGEVDAIEPGPSGASGARTFRLRRAGGDQLLRVEGDLVPGRNPHQYANLQAASEAGIAPPVRLADEPSGVLVMAWIETKPLASHPGGAAGLAREIGALIGQLQRIDPFPDDEDWAEKVGRLLRYVQDAGIFAPGVLDDVTSGYDRLCSSWPRDLSRRVPAHNDPNASNLLYDGGRLWLVDWETSSPNDPLVDLAVVANQLAPTPDLQHELLSAWRPGDPPDAVLRARLRLAQVATQVFAGCAIALMTSPPGQHAISDLDAPTPAAFERQVMSGAMPMGAPETMATFAKVVLAGVREIVASADFEESLRVSST